MYHVRLYGEILMDELRRTGVVCKDAADFCGCKKYMVGAFSSEKLGNCSLIAQVELRMATQQQISVAPLAQATNKSGTDEPAVPGNEDEIRIPHSYS